jgi:hypothetical protein
MVDQAVMDLKHGWGSSIRFLFEKQFFYVVNFLLWCHLSISTQISKLKYQYSQIASDFHFLQAVCRALKSQNFVEQFLFPLFEFSFKRQGLTFGETVFFP